ncbi:MmcQ/YjbR family DNA-binding protein [Antrihabitans sp. YC3-6]|uniref:MmcQ/YjbR family DNA-binding protein n=1 Tax=Antrihabitans stalagmiti TaxID=2799499 RepID=A0A934NM78_9NOCA|nr:MmcQ/YjbR family DNA-binding protein [Antrihabitans stalagmiti]MBJ8337789.1 MmcQ/YjbR family DNA-binding protein [Antrihabitans stalagmiti]
MADRPDVPREWVERLRDILGRFPSCEEESAWVGIRWRVGSSTVAHVFGGEDQLFRILFRSEPSEVLAFENLGPPYFKTEWGTNTVGLIIDDETDWDELTEMLTDSYCLQAPARLAEQVERPGD